MSEKEYVNFLAQFDKELWTKFQDKLSPYGESIKGVVTDLIKIFVGDLETVNEKVLEDLKKILGGDE